MDPLKFDIDELESRLSALRPIHRVAFAASCCERILPRDQSPDTYQTRCAALRSELDRIWLALRADLSLDILRAAEATCSEVIPGTAAFAAHRLTAALCAGRAMQKTAECLRDGNPRRAAEAAAHAVASISAYLRCLERISGSRRAEELSRAQSLLADELQRQGRLLDALSVTSENDEDLIPHPWLREPAPASYLSDAVEESRAAA